MIDTILFNGKIITHDPKQPRVSALAISGGKIVAMGGDGEMLDLARPYTRRENLNGRLVVPGLTDAHLHGMYTARILRDVDVFEVPKQVAIDRVAERARRTPPGTWIVGTGWTQEVWEDKQFPDRDDLDAVTPDHPVYLRSKSIHAYWVNSKALEIAGITRDTPNPEGGQIVRDHNGEPTGLLLENPSQITKHIPPMSIDDTVQAMREVQGIMLENGLTGWHDFDGPDCLRALQVLRERGQLQMRVLKNVNDTYIDHAIHLGLRWGFGDEWLRLGGLKIFADGALGPRTAHMLAPYHGEPNNYGVIVTQREEMLELVSRASAAGIPSTVHAIGDAAVRNVLDVYEEVRKEEAARSERPDQRRHRIEHVQLIHPDDLGRLAAMKIVASIQPIHATSDWEMADTYWGDRSQLAYNARAQLDLGAPVAFGSDSPVDTFKPLEGIYAAVARRRPDGSPGPEGWYPENRLTMDETIRGYTEGPAYAAGLEHSLGRLAPGFWADLVMWDMDLYKAALDEILDANVAGTMTAGVWRHGGV